MIGTGQRTHHSSPFNDLATLCGRPRRLTVGGRVYRLFPQTLGTLARLQRWLDDQAGDTDEIACANIGGLSHNAQGYLLNEGCWRVDRRRGACSGRPGPTTCYPPSAASQNCCICPSHAAGGSRGVKGASELYWRLDAAGHRKVLWTIWGQAGNPDYGGTAPDRPEPIDFLGIFHKLMKDFGYTPRQVAGLTWPQVLCALGDGKAPQSGIDIQRFGKAEYLMRKKEDPWFP